MSKNDACHQHLDFFIPPPTNFSERFFYLISYSSSLLWVVSKVVFIGFLHFSAVAILRYLCFNYIWKKNSTSILKRNSFWNSCSTQNLSHWLIPLTLQNEIFWTHWDFCFMLFNPNSPFPIPFPKSRRILQNVFGLIFFSFIKKWSIETVHFNKN